MGVPDVCQYHCISDNDLAVHLPLEEILHRNRLHKLHLLPLTNLPKPLLPALHTVPNLQLHPRNNNPNPSLPRMRPSTQDKIMLIAECEECRIWGGDGWGGVFDLYCGVSGGGGDL